MKGRSKGEKYEAKENRSGFEKVNTGWIRTRMWLAARARTYIKNKNKKIRTIVIFTLGPCSAGDVNIGQSFTDLFTQKHIEFTHNVQGFLPMSRTIWYYSRLRFWLSPYLYPSSESPVVWQGQSLFVGSCESLVSDSVPQFVTISAQSLLFSWDLCPKAQVQSV